MLALIFNNGVYLGYHTDPENMDPTTLTYDLVEELPEVISNTPAGYAVKRISEGVYELYELPKPEPTPADKITALESENTALKLALAELAETQEADKLATQLALAELAELVAGGD